MPDKVLDMKIRFIFKCYTYLFVYQEKHKIQEKNKILLSFQYIIIISNILNKME